MTNKFENNKIPDWAFDGNTALTSMDIPDGVTEIGVGAFYGCLRLTSVTIPASVTVIKNNAFDGCTGLTEIAIPESVIAIGNHAFRRCSNLAAINVAGCNSGVLLSKSKKTLITCPEGREGEFTIPEGVTAIGERAFEGCTKLLKIIIPEGVTSIGDNAFEKCDELKQIVCLCATPPKVSASSLPFVW